MILALSLVGCNTGDGKNGEATEDIQTVYIEANEYAFVPDHVEVNKGEVKFVIKNTGSRMHGFGIEELGVDIRLAPGETVEQVIQFDEAKTYELHCTVLCGSLDEHHAMHGMITVK